MPLSHSNADWAENAKLKNKGFLFAGEPTNWPRGGRLLSGWRAVLRNSGSSILRTAISPALAFCAGLTGFHEFANAADSKNILERNGIKVEMALKPIGSKVDRNVRRGETGVLTFSITDLESGEPVSGLYPAAWIDPLGESAGDPTKECKERAGLYLRRMIGIRPMIDLNSYFVMVLNADPSISIIDPIIGMTGITKLYTQVLLPGPGVDWVKSSDEKRLYVSIPRTKSVAVVDLETFKVIKNITVGPDPEKLMIQPDNRYLWVGHAKDGGVSVVDLMLPLPGIRTRRARARPSTSSFPAPGSAPSRRDTRSSAATWPAPGAAGRILT